MKLKATSLFLGICLAALASAASPASARTVSGFTSFHVGSNVVNAYKTNPYNCVTEWYGAAVNYCKESVGLDFSLPIDTAGSHSVSVTDLWFGLNAPINCGISSYTGKGESGGDVQNITFTGLSQTLQATINVPTGGYIQVICILPAATSNKSPGGAGIAFIEWTP